MPPFLIKTLKYTLLGGSLATSAWAMAVYAQISQIPRSKIKTLESVSEAVFSSTTYTIINPRNTKPTADSRSLNIQTSKPVSESQILPHLVKGFFGSYIFFPEAVVLRCLARKFTHFSALESGKEIWSTQQFSNTEAPNRCTLLFGTFQVMDVKEKEDESFVDLAFGSEQGTFDGFHRLSVKKVEDRGLRLRLECVSCNPTDDGTERNFSIGSVTLLRTFHLVYADLLFRAAVANAVQKLKKESVDVRM